MSSFSRGFMILAGAWVLSSGQAVFADVLITDTLHLTGADGASGNWNDTSAGNWAIWYHEGTDPTASDLRPFINEPSPLTQDISVSTGTHNYVLVKNNNGSENQTETVFSFQNGAATGTITVTPDTASYIHTTAAVTPAPTVNQSLVLGDQTITINSLGWYRRDVYAVDKVGGNQALGADGSNDDIGLLQITVTPEPSTLAIAAMASMSLLTRRRR